MDDFWTDLSGWWPYLVGVFNFLVVGFFVCQALMYKSETTSAVAWVLIIIFLPLVGVILFVLFGYQHVSRPLRKKRSHKLRYRQSGPGRLQHQDQDAPASGETPEEERLSQLYPIMKKLARRFDAYALTTGNQIDFYHEGKPAFDAMLAAIRQARHHIHLQTFIFQPDELGAEFLAALTERAAAGVEVRLLYDAVGSHRLRQRILDGLRAAGGRCCVFLPISLLRRSIQINLRNHRKIMVVDGRVGFIGGLNVGDEYLGRVERFGFWRDTHLRLQGPVVADLQCVFAEDWDFAAAERLIPDAPGASPYLPEQGVHGPYPAQIIDSGPDRDLKGIREIYHAAILRARRRVWIASPYFVPDAGLRDALRLAGYQGLDVRFLGQYQPDKLIPQYAARYFWAEMLSAGVKVYQYTKGMMHAKIVLVDDDFASVGTANLDNRSLLLNFEVNCLIYSRQAVAELTAQFERDLETAIRLDGAVYGQRPFAGRLLENACRLLSPVL